MSFEAIRPSWQLILRACLVLLVSAIARFLVKLYQIRRKFQQMQGEGFVSL